MSSQHITAFTDITLTTPYDNITAIPLQLKELTADSVYVNWVKAEDFYQDEMLVRIPLGFAISAGDTVILRVHYSGVPYHESWGGFHYSGNYAFNLGVGISEIPHNLGKAWFPCVDDFTDRAVYDIYGTVDEDMEVIAGGMLVDAIDNGDGTKTYHWHCDYTMPTYLASIAIGDYVMVTDTFQGLERDIPIDIYVRPGDSVKVEGTFINLKDILGIFEGAMGPYPWERVGFTGTAIGAMEHATNIYVPHNTITGSTSYESLMAHEASHMWVGDMVTCSSAGEMWLNEGWATFFQYYYALILYDDPDQFKTDMRATHASVLQSCHTPSGDGSYFPLNQIPEEHTYGMAAYDKGATVVQALRFYLGDSLFFETLKAYLQEFAWSAASSYDMRDLMSGYTGMDMSGFFDNWVLNSGTPHYSVDSFNVVGPQYTVIIDVKQKRKGPAFTGDGNIMEVTFMDENWNMHTDTLSFDGETGTVEKTVPFYPSVVLVDLEEKMFDATTDNYKIIHETGSVTFEKTFFNLQVDDITDSALVQVTHNWAPPDSLKTPVAGLRLSDYRYWHIDGILPGTFQATGKFYYARSGYLDNNLILNEEDSIVILFRKNASEDWQSVDFEQIGNWNIGNLIVPDLQLGEYTLGVWDTQVGVPVKQKKDRGSLNIYPNPSGGSFSIMHDYPGNARIAIYSPGGVEIRSFHVDQAMKKLTWDPADLSSGTYTICLFSADNYLIDKQMAIYAPW
jgi:aminopeptidase N